MHPIIGITCSKNCQDSSYYLKDYYITSVQQAGGIPVLLPPSDETEAIAEYLKFCQGIILSGGGDVDPVYWGELPGPELGEIDPQRDQFELQLVELIMENDMPVLGICRGCQVLNIACGGSIIGDLQTGLSHRQNAPRDYPFHDIVVEKASLLHEVISVNRLRVNSFHHQAVRVPGKGLRISAWAADGTVEAIEGIEKQWLLGVQWHPESMTDEFSVRLFHALVTVAEKNQR
ncbi:MAG: type 1 glutamine amidotransferase [Syntrophomonadaceae bacterium]|nr:type 1 glutamine amidotransferase [Syntrophomonadaceae bacterium]